MKAPHSIRGMFDLPYSIAGFAVGACAISGGPYRDHAETHNGADSLLPVDLYVPGCPPTPVNSWLRVAAPSSAYAP